MTAERRKRDLDKGKELGFWPAMRSEQAREKALDKRCCPSCSYFFFRLGRFGFRIGFDSDQLTRTGRPYVHNILPLGWPFTCDGKDAELIARVDS